MDGRLFLLAVPASVLLLSAGTVPGSDAACLARFDKVGVPRHKLPAAEADQFRPILCRRGYALSFNLRTRNPDWVIERLTPATLRGKAQRSSRFFDDPDLAAVSPRSEDFTRSGYDRGHQAPAADARASADAMRESFYMSNISPQVGAGFNRGVWGSLERQVRAWVLCGGRRDLIVVTGPIYGTSKRTISARPILVPEGYYKVVYDVRGRHAVGFKLFNRRYPRTPLTTLVVPIASIEAETGLDFFPALGPVAQRRLEEGAAPPWPPTAGCAAA